MNKHLRGAEHPSWHYRDNLRSVSKPVRGLTTSGPSLASGAGADRPPPRSSSGRGGLHAGGGNLHRSWVSSGSHVPSSPSSDESLSRRDRLSISQLRVAPRPSVPTGHLSLIPAVRGELDVERPDPRFGEVPGRGAR